MQLRPAAGHHVRHVQVAQPALGAVGHERPPPRHPVLVAQLRLRRQRLDDDPAHLARTLALGSGPHRQLDEPVRGADQQRRRPPLRVDGAPGHLEDHVPGPHVDARPGQRAACGWRGGLGRQHTHDPPSLIRLLEVGTQQARPAGPVAPAAPAADVGVRRAQLAVQLPQHVDQVVVATHRLDQRPVARQLRGPVDPGHVVNPEVVAHQPADLVEHLPPLRGGVDRDDDPTRVDLELVRVALLRRVRPGPVRPQHAQRLAVADDQPRAVAAHRVRADRVGDHVELATHQVVALENGPVRLLVVGPPGPEHPLDRRAEPQQAALRRAHPAVAALADRDRHDPVDQPVEIDDDLRRRVLVLLALVPVVVTVCLLRRLRDVLGALGGRVARLGGVQVVGLLVGRRGGPTVRARAERVRGARGQGDEERPPGGREGQVERVLVVDRVEAAAGEERQVAPVRGEGRGDVDEPRLGDGDGHAVRAAAPSRSG